MATLYSSAENFRAQKILSAASFGGVAVSVKEGAPPKDKFPGGEVPALLSGPKALTGDAGILWEVAGSTLKGAKKEEEAEVVGWLGRAEAEYAPAVLGWVLPSLSLLQLEAKAVEAAKAQTHQLLKALDSLLLSRTFLVGERLSLADVSLAFNLLPAFQHVLDAKARKTHQNATRWLTTVLGQPKVKAVIGELVLCKDPAVFDSKAFAANAAKASDSKPQGGKKEKAKKEKPAAAVEEEPMDDEPAPPPKKDPFEAFPKPSFNMEEFKRVYSNEDTEAKALPYLMENIDWENHSIWYCEYKYPEDLGLVFMSCNLISGMMQRLDKLRKNAFASMILFGENNASTIGGLWIWRGPELAFTLSPDWQVDFESYEWTKLDPNADKTKTLIKEYLCWEGDFDGKKFNQGKIFK